MADDSLDSWGRCWGIVCYLSVLCLAPILFKRQDSFVMQHAKQGLILFVWEMGSLAFSVIPLLGQYIWLISFTICSGLSLIGVIQASLGRRWNLPWILGQWASSLDI